MLEGLEVSVLTLKEVLNENETQRIDSEYFRKTYLENAQRLKKISYKVLREIGSVKGGKRLPLGEDFTTEGIPYIRAQDIKNSFIEYENSPRISEIIHKELIRYQTKKDDVLITNVGNSIGDTGIVKFDLDKCNLTENAVKITCTVKIQSEFLFSFLQSKFGKQQIERETVGTAQPKLAIERINKIIVPIASDLFQKELKDLNNESYYAFEQSKNAYQQAEQLLLQELGITEKLWQTKGLAINNKTFKDSFADSGRLDAEYYQPKYDEIINLIRSYKLGSTNLKTLINDYSTGFPFNSDSYVKEGVSLIRINNIKKGELDISNAAKVSSSDVSLSPKDVVKENDLLISMSGTIGNCCKIPANTKAIINQRILRFSIKNFDVDVLCLYINSIFGELQLERVGTGGVQTNISTGDIFNIELPLLDEVKQQKIASLIQQSFQLRKQSKHLLEVAKQAVEMAIETDEATALAYIKANTY